MSSGQDPWNHDRRDRRPDRPGAASGAGRSGRGGLGGRRRRPRKRVGSLISRRSGQRQGCSLHLGSNDRRFDIVRDDIVRIAARRHEVDHFDEQLLAGLLDRHFQTRLGHRRLPLVRRLEQRIGCASGRLPGPDRSDMLFHRLATKGLGSRGELMSRQRRVAQCHPPHGAGRNAQNAQSAMIGKALADDVTGRRRGLRQAGSLTVGSLRQQSCRAIASSRSVLPISMIKVPRQGAPGDVNNRSSSILVG